MLTFAIIVVTIVYLSKKGFFTVCKRWMRLLLAYVYMRYIKNKQPIFPFDVYSKNLGQLGIVSLPEATFRENPRKLNNNIHAFDSIRIWGANKDGYFMYMQLSRRHNRSAEITLFFRSNNGEAYQLPFHPDTNVYNTDGKTFCASGLSFEILEPLRRWRINFNGFLRRVKDQELVETSFNFLWFPASCYVAFPEDFNPLYVAKYLSQQNQISPSQFLETQSAIESYENSGQLIGTLKMAEISRQLIIRGFKIRSHGLQNWEKVQNKMVIEAYLHDGSAVKVFVEDIGSEKKFIYGYVLPPCNMIVLHLKQCHVDADVIVKGTDFNFTAGSYDYSLHLRMRNEFKAFHGSDWIGESTVNYCDVTLNGTSGDGVMNVLKRNYGHCPLPQRCSLALLSEPDIKHSSALVVTFSDVECCSSAVVGGKAASLALINRLELCHEKFVVPPGVSVTKTAFEIHVRHNPKIEEAILELIRIAWSGEEVLIKTLEKLCDSVVRLISETRISPQLQEHLLSTLNNTFNEPIENIRFAVRSSAIGEDGEEMSAAGQNETFLGIRGFNQVCAMISKCWASQFAFRSVEYKRQNGQLLNSGMGVVIQQMVPAEAAGVLFSRDPLTGSYASMTITSNYGLGESVVSAIADPDTIIIRRSYDDHLNVQQISTGSKKTFIQMSDGNGTTESETEAKIASKCSLSEDMAIKLAKIALFLEKCFGNGRDIEWAIKDQQIYILQSRPVTTDSTMTDIEIIHEFNTLFRTDEENFTTANSTEVLPGCQTPLSMTSFLRCQIPYFQKRMMWRIDRYRYDPIVIEWMSTFYGHVMMDLTMQKAWCTSDKKDAMLKALDMGLYGKIVEEGDIMRRALHRYKIKPPLRKRMVMMFAFTLRGMIMGGKLLQRATSRYQNYRVPLEGNESIKEVYKKIEECFTHIDEIFDSHLSVTFASTFWNVIILNVLSNGNDDFSTDHYSDFAILIGSCNGAESGNVPASLGELSHAIGMSEHHKNFAKQDPQMALDDILNSKDSNVKKIFMDFIARHGHRGMKEADLICKTWGSEPTQVIKILQEMSKMSSCKARQLKSADDVIQQLKSDLTPFRKKILSWVMKFCRRGICHREAAKSLLIKYLHGFRVAYAQLAIMMVKQGYLVDPQLLYFFNHEELAQLIDSRSPKLIRRAKNRKRLFDYKDRLKFPEFIHGFPKPINDIEEEISAAEYSSIIKGYPISQGVVKAKARVVASFHDVNTIQPGEILITRATDIGWSPYFPMLAGIVTEIGGLVSHGAVVAREFGLPCIVGVDNATKLFHSGDLVLLNATQGTIMKIKESD